MSRTPGLIAHVLMALISVLSVWSGSEALAWELTYNSEGQPLRWHEEILRVGVVLSPDFPDQTESVVHALNEWNEALDGRVTLVLSSAEQANIVVSWTEVWPYDEGYLALSTLEHRLSGRLVDAKIELNPRMVLREDRFYDLHTVLAHELGHVLGLAHEHDVHDAVMAPSIAPNTVSGRSLHPDDVDGVQFLYSLPMDEVFHCSSVSTTAGPWSVVGLGFWLIFALVRRPRLS